MRSKYYESVPITSSSIQEYAIPTKIRLLEAHNRSGGNKSFRQIAAEYAPSFGTASRWKEKHRILGSPAFSRTRKLSIWLGKPRKIDDPKTSRLLVDPKRNLVQNQAFKPSYTIMASIQLSAQHNSRF